MPASSAANEFDDWTSAPGAREAVRRLADLFAMLSSTTETAWWCRLYDLTRTAPPREEGVLASSQSTEAAQAVAALEKAHLAFTVAPFSAAAFDIAQLVGWWFAPDDPELHAAHMTDFDTRALPYQLHGGAWSWRHQSFGAHWVRDAMDAAWIVTRAYAAGQVRRGEPAPWRFLEQRAD